MSSDRELLQRACDRINDLDVPAFIKDGSLRYVAVNDAYASRCGTGRDAFAGRVAADMTACLEDEACLEKQRRSLVFGSDETAPCRDGAGVLRHEMRVERFVTEDDRAYLFAVFEPVAWQPETVAEFDAGPVDVAGGLRRGQVSLEMLGTALDLLDAGIGIFSETDTLLYFNDQLAQYFESLGGRLHPQMPLRDLVEQVCRFQMQDMPELADAPRQREEWIEERMRTLHVDHWQAMEPLADGRWMRSVNRRLDNGWLIMLRLDVTEYKVQEIRLGRKIEETEIFRAAFEDLPVAVFLRDSQRRLIYANHAYETLLGAGRDQMMGLTEEAMFPTEAARFREENETLLSGGGAIEKTDDVPLANGGTMAAITRLARISSPAGEPYIVGSITDVTLVRRAQEEAERLHREVQSILDSLPVGVVILDARRHFEYANRTFRQLFCQEEKVDAENAAAYDNLDYRDFIRKAFERGNYATPFLHVEEFIAERMRALEAEDEMPPVELHSRHGRTILMSRQHLADGKMLLSYVDVTAVKRREQEVQEARAALEQHGAMMHDATSVMSQGLLILREGRIVFSNEALAKILQAPPALVQAGKPWRAVFAYLAARGDFGSPEQAEETFRYWQTMETEGQGFSASLCIEDTCFVDVEMNLSANGNWLAVFADVTEVRMRERELQRLLGRAEAADRAKSEFLANMSHEIRTPMNGVLGMAELLAKSNLDTRQKTFTDIIVKSGNALLTIINDILDFSKIDAGQMTLRRAAFDPVEAIEDVATLLSSSAAEKDIELLVRGAATHHTVIGDPGRFRQIVTNLVGNAVKFTERGHVLIDVTSEPTGEDSVTLTIRIEDTGLGIPEDQLKTIFEKFSQVDTSSTRRYEGTGLGLAITAGLVDLFGGRITVESRLGQGSVFTVTLPFAVASMRVSGEVPVASIRGARVVVIDDNPVNRQILTEQLAMWDFDCVAVESGEEGLRLLRAAVGMGVTVDALILDYHMPEMSGLDVAGAIRSDPALADLAIIFLTSMDTASSEEAFQQLHIQAHLMKPARSNLLRSTIGEVIRASRQQRRPGRDVSVGAEAAETRLAGQAGTSGEAAGVPPQGLDVLVAEDNEVNQIVFTQILQATGLRFHIVPNGEEAVAAWRSHRPALILMDVSMPVMNGHQATRRIREIEAEEGGHVPIVGVTAHALDSDRDLCLASGMDDYLSKPISPEILEAKIGQWRRPVARAGEGSRP
ncbi:response regulator [Rhizobium sp. CSW-27]|uniref:response regulator n=1 Tax=Rhizobium sp. CSW-27 TaxID=2839985 RepID=UPI0020791302|nr:response regulator [Rhizobium sp. CSW-27]